MITYSQYPAQLILLQHFCFLISPSVWQLRFFLSDFSQPHRQLRLSNLCVAFLESCPSFQCPSFSSFNFSYSCVRSLGRGTPQHKLYARRQVCDEGHTVEFVLIGSDSCHCATPCSIPLIASPPILRVFCRGGPLFCASSLSVGIHLSFVSCSPIRHILCRKSLPCFFGVTICLVAHAILRFILTFDSLPDTFANQLLDVFHPIK